MLGLAVLGPGACCGPEQCLLLLLLDACLVVALTAWQVCSNRGWMWLRKQRLASPSAVQIQGGMLRRVWCSQLPALGRCETLVCCAWLSSRGF